jgi:hypothetical protein
MRDMSRIAIRELARRFRDQHGVISRSQLHALGVSTRTTQRKLAIGEWEKVSSKTVRLAGSPQTPEQDLLALWLTAGPSAIASHQSAAWLWQLAGPPEVHAVTVPRTVSSRAVIGEVHRPADFPAHIVTLRNIPCTNPLRTIVDVAAVTTPEELEGVIDRALANQLVSMEAVEAELDRLARQGRRGVEALRAALGWRKAAGVAHPSVLESRTLRLLHRAGVKPLAVEVKANNDLSYRVDILLRPGLAIEVDGYAYHRSPEQMAEDARRRNRLHLSGTRLLVYTWRDIVYDGYRVIAEVRLALAQAPEPARTPPAELAG